MEQQVLFVSEVKIKNFTNINFNTSPTDLVPYILDAQNILLPNYLGATYYKALKERITDNTLTDQDKYLLDNYIGFVICNYGFYYAIPFLKYRVNNKGIMSGTSENSDNTNLQEVKFLQENVLKIAQAYSEQMIIHLRRHPNDYPLYITPNALDGQLPDRNDTFNSGLAIPHYPFAGKDPRRWRLYMGGNGYYWGGWDPYAMGWESSK